MQALYVSTIAVAVAEIGDKTQLLSLLLAAKYRRPWPICAGILLATVLNHALAGALGAALAPLIPPATLKWLVAACFLAVAIWTLVPDTLDADDASTSSRRNVLLTTVLVFFLAEMGDKTQVATVLLAVQYSPLWEVVAGSTLGMLLANVPVVFLGARLADRLPLRAARIGASMLFGVLALWIVLR